MAAGVKPSRDKNGDSVLDLCGRHLMAVPESVFIHTNIDILRLSENRLTVLPAAATSLKLLRVLELRKNSLEVFPEPILEMRQLRSVDLSFNKLSSVSKGVTNLINLTVLLLNNNNFKKFPEEVCQIKNLERLDLSNCNIERIPGALSRLRALADLDVSNNKIAEISGEIYANKNLSSLNLSNNKLEKLPALLCVELKKLDDLTLKGNDLKEPPKDVCSQGLAGIRNYQQEKQRQLQTENANRSMDPYRPTPLSSYRMRRGVVAIMSNIKYKTRENRPGSKVDADRLKSAFSNYPFEVQVFENLDGDEMLYSLKLLRKIEQDIDCLFVFLLCHGTLTCSLGCDGRSISLKDIVELFYADSCPKMIGKPKLFFQQAFQSDAKDPGQLTLPSEDDFMLGSAMIATAEGYRTATQQSSPYIESICRFIKENGSVNHMAEIMTMVADDMKTKTYKVGGKSLKMNTALFGTLTKRMWLTDKVAAGRR
ncbi:uncharacterized protein [Ptychodera flava]|uniref:uncharacterized protein n=1 Tax=Ptychodera flava TaxID=63121 RepID=UPI00396A08B6